MKSTYISIALFLCVLGFVGFADYKLENLCNDIVDECKVIETELYASNFEEAEKLSKDLTKEIKNSTIFSAVYVNHCDFDTLTNESIKLSKYAESKNDTESITSVSLLKEYAKNLKELHDLSIKNIF